MISSTPSATPSDSQSSSPSPSPVEAGGLSDANIGAIVGTLTVGIFAIVGICCCVRHGVRKIAGCFRERRPAPAAMQQNPHVAGNQAMAAYPVMPPQAGYPYPVMGAYPVMPPQAGYPYPVRGAYPSAPPVSGSFPLTRVHGGARDGTVQQQVGNLSIT